MPVAEHRRGAHVPRAQRDLERIRRAAREAQAASGSAMASALAQIGAAFDDAAVVNAFKIRVERLLQLGPHHAVIRARFGARAALLRGRGLDAATIVVERWWREERKALQIASALGCGTRLSFDVLSELRLVLRLMRLKRMAAEFAHILAALCEQPIAAAAE